MTRVRLRLAVATLVGASLAGAGRAHADDPGPDPAPDPSAATGARPDVKPRATTHKRPPKRPIPNYDGRGPAPDDTIDGLLFLPRVVLFPIRIVIDYGIRRPLGALVRGAERSRGLRATFRWAFMKPKRPTPAFFPVALYDFGFKPSIGGRLYWTNGFLTPGSKLSVKLGTGGLDTWRADVAVRVARGAPYASLDLGIRQRPDLVFYGLGPDTPPDAESRYLERRLGMTMRIGSRLPRSGEVSLFGTVARHRFETSTYAGNPSIEEAVAAGLIDATPAGYVEGYTAVSAGITLAYDTRARNARRQASGTRLDTTIEQVWDGEDRSQRWTRIDATAGAALLLDPVAERKLDVKLRVQLIEASAGTSVPFTELATTGGLRGFASGRLRGESAVQLTADYQWPIAAWLDAHAHAGVGNVFDAHLRGMSAGAFRGSAGIGLSIAGLSAERQIRFAAAIGTEPLGGGVDVSSFRLVLGFASDY